MTASNMVRSALIRAGKTQGDLASYMGCTKQNISDRLKRNTLTFDELSKALGFCGFTAKLLDDQGREVPNLNNSTSPRVVQMVDGVTYDTAKAESLCDSKAQDGEEFFTELFQDASGEFFVVHYQAWEGGKSTISPLSQNAAQRVYKLYTGSPDLPD